MARRKTGKSNSPSREPAPAPPPRAPYSPPPKRGWLLALAIALFTAWLLLLFYLARVGEARFGQ